MNLKSLFQCLFSLGEPYKLAPFKDGSKQELYVIQKRNFLNTYKNVASNGEAKIYRKNELNKAAKKVEQLNAIA